MLSITRGAVFRHPPDDSLGVGEVAAFQGFWQCQILDMRASIHDLRKHPAGPAVLWLVTGREKAGALVRLRDTSCVRQDRALILADRPAAEQKREFGKSKMSTITPLR
jgi:hypothetical protein